MWTMAYATVAALEPVLATVKTFGVEDRHLAMVPKLYDVGLTVTVVVLGSSDPETVAVAGPVVPPVAVRVCVPCDPTDPPVLIVTVTTQVPPAAALQEVGDTEYGLLKPLIVSVADSVPLLVKVTVPLALTPPLIADSAEALFAVIVTIEPPPEPLRLAVSVPAPVTMLKVPVRAATAVGWNLTETVQLAPTASVAAQVVDTKLKSVPVTDDAVGIVTLKDAIPLLASVEVSVVEAPTLTMPKAIADSCPVRIGPVPVVAEA